MNQKEKDALVKSIRNKKIKKYVLTVFTMFIVVSVAIGLSIEQKDSKIADGNGNVIVDNAGDALDSGDVKVSDEEKGDKIEKDKNDKKDKKSKRDKKDKKKSTKKMSKQKAAAKKQDEKLSKLSDKEKAKIEPKDVAVKNNEDFTASNGGNKALRPKVPQPVTVTLEIYCNTLSNDMDRLEEESIRDYIPKDGVILAKTKYSGTTDNTVFDALNTLCRNNNIQMEFSYTPLFESNYIEGINYLYEFHGGPQSGWMYKVNGWFPNYGCSSYYLSDGDEIVWAYTCEGLGTDIGAPKWMG